MAETGSPIKPEDISTTPPTHRIPLDKKTLTDQPALYGHYMHPTDRDNPFRGGHTIKVRETTNPTALRQLVEDVRKNTATCPILPEYEDTRTAYVAMLDQIAAHASEKSWAETVKRTTQAHEETHAMQEIRTQALSLADDADSLRGHWYEKPPYRRTREIQTQAFDVAVLTEVQATMAANRIQKDPETQKASAEFEAIRMARVVQLFQNNPETGKSQFDELWIYVKDSMLSKEPVDYPAHILSYLIVLTKNPRLIADIRASKHEVNRKDLATTVMTALKHIAYNPKLLNNTFQDDTFYIAVDQELMKQAETLKKNLYLLKNQEED